MGAPVLTIMLGVALRNELGKEAFEGIEAREPSRDSLLAAPTLPLRSIIPALSFPFEHLPHRLADTKNWYSLQFIP